MKFTHRLRIAQKIKNKIEQYCRDVDKSVKEKEDKIISERKTKPFFPTNTK